MSSSGLRVAEVMPSLLEAGSCTKSMSKDKERFRTGAATRDVLARGMVGPKFACPSSEGVMGIPLVWMPLRWSGDMTGNCRLSGDVRGNLRGLSRDILFSKPSSMSNVNFFGAGEAKQELTDSLALLKGDMVLLTRGPKPSGVGSKVLDSTAKGCGCAMCGVSCPLDAKRSVSDGENGMPGDCSPIGVVAKSLPRRFRSSSWCSLLWGVSGAGTKSSF